MTHANGTPQGYARCQGRIGSARALQCLTDALIAPDGWEPYCSEHFPRSDYERDLKENTLQAKSVSFRIPYTLEELRYLENMGLPVLSLLADDDCPPALHNQLNQEKLVRETAASDLIAFVATRETNEVFPLGKTRGGFPAISSTDADELRYIARKLAGCVTTPHASDCASFVAEPCDCVIGGGKSESQPEATLIGKVHPVFLPILDSLMRPQDWERAEKDRTRKMRS